MMLHKRPSPGLTLIFLLILSSLILVFCNEVLAQDDRWNISLETGAVWQDRNEVQIPGDTGTRFLLDELAGKGPFVFYRLEMLFNAAPRHQIRLLIAPFRYTESGVLEKDVFFVDQTFTASQNTEATYKFNSYRATYRYLFHRGSQWRWWAGATVKIRDAEIGLRQSTVFARDSNVGVVPLINLYGNFQFADKWSFIFDLDGLVGPQGRALDLGLKIIYDITGHWYVGAGYRTLEGGADNDEVFNFAWFNYAIVTVGNKF
ncbi:MAG: hypothetical protein JSV21_05490 [Nitrospirota bacterium]|nr:MAG: hypothetical protein JSV21_05490 [Nitrospirota bacterium]